ncbi:MAG: hypothetical protein Q9160_001034 [Pyrenula sp. 1 TL-2023]
MLSRTFILGALLSLPTSILSQGTSVPSSLSSGFQPSAIELQVSFTGDASEGLNDGSTVQLQQTSNTPTFALGDSSGVSTVIQFIVMMLDTTEPNNMALHFLQSGLKSDGEKTQISSDGQPQFAYKKPGSLGETGQRQYSFLLFRQTGQGSVSGVSGDGSKFDVNSFIKSNSLKAAQAGIAIKVDVGGGNGNGGGNGGGQSSQSQTQTQAQSQSQSRSQSQSTSASSSGNSNGGSSTQVTSTIATSTTAAGNSASKSASGAGGASTSTFGPVTFQSPSVATSAPSQTGMTTATGSPGGGESAGTSATGAAGSTMTIMTTAGAGGAGASPSGEAGASGTTSSSPSQVTTNGAGGIRCLSGALVGAFGAFVGYLLL